MKYPKKYLCLSKAVFLLALTGLLSCKSKKETISEPVISLTSECPKDGNCSVKLNAHKAIELKTDEFGRLYYTLVDDDAKSVYQYTYNRKVKGNLQDAQYREEVIFEVSNQDNMSLANEALAQQKVLFGRFCYCKGQTGYYAVKQGKLVAAKNQKQTSVDLRFTITEVPQITQHISWVTE